MKQPSDIAVKKAAGRFHGDLPERTFRFASMIVTLFDQIPSCPKGWVLGRQLLRSGTSIGANVCEADQALTEAEFVQRCGIARKEASETEYWLRLCVQADLLSEPDAAAARQEAHELLCILAAMVRKCQNRAATEVATRRRSKNSAFTEPKPVGLESSQ